MSEAVRLVTVKSLRTLFKNGEPAERIELVNVEDHDFDVVAQKGLYNIGDKAVFISPDWCLPLPGEPGTPNSPAVKLFLDFTMPDGDEKKSKLGKGGRIRAIKFNFQLEGKSDPVYSVGIMMPMSMIKEAFPMRFNWLFEGGEQSVEDLDTYFEVTKYEEPETAGSGMAAGSIPAGMYKTDETNIKNLRVQYPIDLTGTLKVDGSSITVYYRDEEHKGICSRSLEKKLDQTIIKGYKTPEGHSVRKHYDRDTNTRGWLLQVADNSETPDQFIGTFFAEPLLEWTPITEVAKDSFIDHGMPILAKLEEYCKVKGLQLAIRGELHGTGLKGSGNKNNPHAKVKQGVLIYAVDDYSAGFTKILPLDEFYAIAEDLGLETCPIIFRKTFESAQELTDMCEEYFRTNLVEGIVVKDQSAQFSAKFMNNAYDASK